MNRPRRPLTERIAELVVGKPHRGPRVAPKGVKQICFHCRAEMLPGSIYLHATTRRQPGVCGQCRCHGAPHGIPAESAPCERPETPDEPPQHAA